MYVSFRINKGVWDAQQLIRLSEVSKGTQVMEFRNFNSLNAMGDPVWKVYTIYHVVSRERVIEDGLEFLLSWDLHKDLWWGPLFDLDLFSGRGGESPPSYTFKHFTLEPQN